MRESEIAKASEKMQAAFIANMEKGDELSRQAGIEVGRWQAFAELAEHSAFADSPVLEKKMAAAARAVKAVLADFKKNVDGFEKEIAALRKKDRKPKQ